MTHLQPNDNGSSSRDASYYLSCVAAGGMSSSMRWFLSPLELAKTQLQAASATTTASVTANKVRGNISCTSSVVGTLHQIYASEGLTGLFRGVVPTAAAYGIQTSLKYGCYEFFKDQLSSNEIITDDLRLSQSTIYVLSAASAEAIADVFMCPFEMIKVQMQTNPHFPQSIRPAFLELWRTHPNFPFGSLGPLWARQVPGTIVNFFTFEHSIQFLYHTLFQHTHYQSKEELSPLQQLGVTMGAGYMAGICSAVLSHPADSLISLSNTSKYRGWSLRRIISHVGWYKLATKGLAPRIIVISQIISGQWILYDAIKQMMGYGTSGGTVVRHSENTKHGG
jgi:solute carrier family 25 (mitochondrial phosphate transporter), member 3